MLQETEKIRGAIDVAWRKLRASRKCMVYGRVFLKSTPLFGLGFERSQHKTPILTFPLFGDKPTDDPHPLCSVCIECGRTALEHHRVP